MHYILPVALKDCKDTFVQACSMTDGQLNKTIATQARALLESLMLRRVKAGVGMCVCACWLDMCDLGCARLRRGIVVYSQT